ncbi:MAG TPA: large conductance mechanosensitive channel protein MscL, partial [Syntrophorhabdus aromaticivorans]|nr:large conductance mechanosensitive channel protein MscL [Syntrophorhabdus aromaticivorans]
FFLTIKEGKLAGPYATLAAAKSAGAVTVNIGVFINTIISFVIVAFSVFIVIKNVNRFKKEPPPVDPTTKECPFCLSLIPIKAVRCPHCTSELKA